MNKCMYCGADLAESSKFCPNCGKEQVEEHPSIIATEPVKDDSSSSMDTKPEVTENVVSNSIDQSFQPPLGNDLTPPSIPEAQPVTQMPQPQIPQPAVQQPTPSQIQTPNNSQQAPTPKKKNEMVEEIKNKLKETFVGKVPVWGVILMVAVVAMLLGYIIGSSTHKSYSSGGTVTSSEKSKKYKLGDTFNFSNFKITLGTNVEFSTVTNQYSEYLGQTVVKVPVIIKNTGSEAAEFTLFDYSFIGSKGIEVEDIGRYDDTDCIKNVGKLAPNATSAQSYFYMLYDGDGQYLVYLDNFRETVTIEVNVKK